MNKKLILIIAVVIVSIFGGLIGYLLNNGAEHQKEIDKLIQQQKETTALINETNKQLIETNEHISSSRSELDRLHKEISRQASRSIKINVTAYDLSVTSCGKAPGDSGYGMTASGVCLAGQTLNSARAIAVDPSVIPLGTKVRIKFDDPNWSHLNGVYTAVDTGGAINGNHIDLFFGENSYYECMSFGNQNATLYFL